MDEYATFVEEISGGGTTPADIYSQSIFTGATIPLTHKDNTIDYENNYVYKSENYNITIAGLDGRATVTNNGTKEVTVSFDVTSAYQFIKELYHYLCRRRQYTRFQRYARSLWCDACFWKSFTICI